MVAALVLAATAAGCKTMQETEITGSLGAASAPQGGADSRAAQAWGERYRANPKDPDYAIEYAHALRGTGQPSQAAVVLEQALLADPKHAGLLGAYGRALAGMGRYKQALDVFTRAHKSGQPNWNILSAQGAVLDQMGRHDDARRHYGTALRIVPDEPSVLSNLGLSYALSKDLVRAEAALRRAAGHSTGDARVRRNLALVVGLQGRSAEADGITQADMQSDNAAVDVAYLRQILAEQNGWKPPTTTGGR